MMGSPRRGAWIEVDLEAVRKNVEKMKALLKQSVLFMAVVKADAYGHGAVQVSRAALQGGADRLGVAFPGEGAALREAGIKAPVHLLSEIAADEIPLVLEYDLIPTVYTIDLARQLDLEARTKGMRQKIHLKIDTGMNRVGVPAVQASEMFEQLSMLTALEIEGVFTHFASADLPESSLTLDQFSLFEQVLSDIRPRQNAKLIRHSANSAATVLFPETHLDMVRCGISIYGLHPSNATRERIDLTPALALKAKITMLKTIAEGEGVSYGHTFKASRPTKVATLPLGYADGYPRSLSNRSEVLAGSQRAPVIGNICMDQLMVDVTDAAGIKVDDLAVLIGRQATEKVSADELAGILGTINYEITCMLGKRLPRVYLNDGLKNE